jgi:1-acyl-sn-glycerol-3-phosphate acyltransferase
MYFFLTTLWTKLLVATAFLDIHIEGKDNVPKFPDNPSIIIANHSSALDIFLLESLIGTYPHMWILKDLYTKIPLFNILVKRMHVPVKRENPRHAIRSLYKVYELCRGKKNHVILFPEGKRYDDGKIHQFLSGFAILAKKLNRPVIPIIIGGVYKIFPKKRLIIDSKASQVKLIIGKPFVYQNDETEKEFIKRVHDYVVSKVCVLSFILYLCANMYIGFFVSY